MKRRKWMPEYDEYIKENYGILTTREIAEKIGCSPCWIVKKARKLGIDTKARKPKRIPDETIDKMIKLAKKGKTSRQIAKECFVSQFTVTTKLKALGITLKRNSAVGKKRKTRTVYKPKVKSMEECAIRAWKTEVKKEQKNICVMCRNATNYKPGYCSWADRLVPVEGWEIEKTGIIYDQYMSAEGPNRKYPRETFDVKKCPLFEDDRPYKFERLNDEKFRKAFTTSVDLEEIARERIKSNEKHK